MYDNNNVNIKTFEICLPKLKLISFVYLDIDRHLLSAFNSHIKIQDRLQTNRIIKSYAYLILKIIILNKKV